MLVPPLLPQKGNAVTRLILLPRAVPCLLLEMHLQLQLEIAHACADDVAAALYRAGCRLAPLDFAAGEDGCDGHEDRDNAVDDLRRGPGQAGKRRIERETDDTEGQRQGKDCKHHRDQREIDHLPPGRYGGLRLGGCNLIHPACQPERPNAVNRRARASTVRA